MARVCSVCRSERRHEIEADLLRGLPYTQAAHKYAPLKRSALVRHKQHLDEGLARAHDVAEVAAADVVLHEVRSLLTEATELRADAKRAGDLKTRTGILLANTKVVELLAKVEGRLSANGGVTNIDARTQVHVDTVYAALAPYPDAQQAVARALQAANP